MQFKTIEKMHMLSERATPEQRLGEAVIMMAFRDLSRKAQQNDAARFFTSDDYVYWCDVCGAEPELVLEIARDLVRIHQFSGSASVYLAKMARMYYN